ncbi:uncharacterized protein LOC34619440 [Cyclospora cayetanensis]|uniref:Uncharacterized protein LOC34619440 n=1 Tax=Cyclospora cayetanensis TaxID=88456 RepID=A0A6P6RT25_9EIME|nr:uncharacterized protein LOC34619440 [Cyclospora cayetanensis]
MAQLPQKLPFEEGASEISDLYEEAIKATIAQCHLVQNGKVLAAIEKQWRHALRKKQVELSRAAASTSQTGLKTPPSASTGASAAAFEGGASSSLPGNTREQAATRWLHACFQSLQRRAVHKGSPAFFGVFVVSATARAASEPPSRATGAPRASETSEPKNEGEDEGDDTDEFEDAEVDAAEEGPPVLGVPQGPLCALRNPTDEGGQPEPRVAATASTGGGVEGSVTAAAVAAAQPPHATENASQQTKESKSLDQEDSGKRFPSPKSGAPGRSRRLWMQDDFALYPFANSDEDREEGFGLSVDDVSDLDDAEPQTTDGIFGFFEKVERSTAGASRRSSKWKVLLRHGILRVGGREIPFDRFNGEFLF